MAAEGTLEHVKLGAQKVDLGADVILQRHAGDDGELAHTRPAFLLRDKEGLHAVAQQFGRDRQ